MFGVAAILTHTHRHIWECTLPQVNMEAPRTPLEDWIPIRECAPFGGLLTLFVQVFGLFLQGGQMDMDAIGVMVNTPWAVVTVVLEGTLTRGSPLKHCVVT